MADRDPHRIAVVGMVGGEVFGAAAQHAIDCADLLVGAVRHLDRIADRASTQRLVLATPLSEVLDAVVEHREGGQRVCVVASGDPGFFGIARTISSRLGKGAVVVHPAPSSVALAFARQGWPWDDAVVASAHGRCLDPAVAAIADATKAAVLTDPSNPPQVLGAALAARHDRRHVVVVSRIGEADESITHTDVAGLAAGRFDPMSVVLLTDPGPRSDQPTATWGRHEATFDHRDGMITKAEVRAVALAKLAVPHRGVLWDVGAGSGSVAVEAALLAPGLRVFAIERNQRDAERIAVNAARLGASVEVVVGEAPQALADLPDPDRVFVGGGGIDVLDACLPRLRPGGVVVATFVLLDRALAAHQRLTNMVQVRIDRCVTLGAAGVRMEPLNPVFVCWGPG